MDNQEIKFEFYYTEAEYLTAARLLSFSSSQVLFRLILFFFLLAGLFLIFVLLFDLDFPLWAVIGLTALVEAALVYNAFVVVPRRYFRGDAKFRDKYEITFSDDGISVKTNQIDSKLAWTLYTKVIEGDSQYLLVYGKDVRMMTVIPKRVFQNRMQEKAFRKMLRTHIIEHSSLGRNKIDSDAESEYTPSSLNPPDWR